MKYTSTDPDGAAAAAPQPAAYQPEVEVMQTPDDEITPGDPLAARVRAAAAHTTATWLGLYRQPPSLHDAWNLSATIDGARVPAQNGKLASLWWLLNYSERLFMFLAILPLLALAATLLWVGCRPSRRWGLYLVLFTVLIIVPAVAGG